MAVVPGIVGVSLHYSRVRQKHVFGKVPKHKHLFYNWPELVTVILLLAASKFLSITWFDLNEISPLRIALG